MQQEILTELHTLERVCEILDIIDIVLGFLSSGGGNADKSLEEYVEEVLKMKTKKFSHKVNVVNCRRSFQKLLHVDEYFLSDSTFLQIRTHYIIMEMPIC